MKKLLKTVVIILLSLTGLSLISLWGANLLIEKKNEEFIKEADSFFSQFPAHQTNKSARNLDKLLRNLDLKPIGEDKQITLENPNRIFSNNLQEDLTKFLNSQLGETSQNIQPIPENLNLFLQQNKPKIKEVKDYILTSEHPTWSPSLTEMFGDPIGYYLPEFQGIINLQKIFILEILANQENTQEINQTLEASFKLNQAVQNHPYLITQFLSLTITKYQLGLLRQINNLAPQWETQINNYYYDYQQGILNSLIIESFIIGSPNIWEGKYASLDFKFFNQPYFQLMSRDSSQRMKKEIDKLENQIICNFNKTEFEKQLETSPWWNITGDIAIPSFSSQWIKGGNAMLDLELTQHILQAQSIKQKTGKYPQTLPNLNSKVCPDQTWQYEIKNNEIILSFSQQLPEETRNQNQENTLNLPINFILK
jgi:hypothetical protein